MASGPAGPRDDKYGAAFRFEFGRARPDCCPYNAIAAIELEEVLAAAARVSPAVAALL